MHKLPFSSRTLKWHFPMPQSYSLPTRALILWMILFMADNMKNPSSQIPNPDHNTTPRTTIPHPPFTFGAKSQKCLLRACELICFYQRIGRSLTAANIQWSPTIINFIEQWKALKERKENDPLETPKILKALPIMKWMEAFNDFLHWTDSIRTIPLAYVLYEDEMT